MDPDTADQTADPPVRKPFAAFVQEQRRGALHVELSDNLAELVTACVETGKKGKLTLTVTVAPMKGSSDGVLTVTDEVRLAVPKADARPAIFYADEHGNLSRNDPRQLEIGLRGVDGGAGRADDGTDTDRDRAAGAGA
jgi:hypothetical protein